MVITPKTIANRIRSAREERHLTQQDLGDHLGKTAAAISELERGKVHQINAIDLFRLSELLTKPIEYFYGEEYAGPDVQDLVALIRIMEPDTRALLLPTIKAMLKMKQLSDRINATNDKTELISLAQGLYAAMQPYLDSVSQLTSSGRDAQDKLSRLLDSHGLIPEEQSKSLIPDSGD
jgi:transcriptional regulator with XRE-family HTH domain